MAESALSLAYDDFIKELAWYKGYGRAVPTDASKLALLDAYLQAGYRRALYPPDGYAWSFFRTTADIVLWPDQTAVFAHIDTMAYNAPTGRTTITMNVAGAVLPKVDWPDNFYSTMTSRHSVAFTSGNSYPVYGYSSANVLSVTGNCSAETTGFTLAADGTYRLPDTFGGIEGDLTHASGTGYPDIPIRGELELRKDYQNVDSAGLPLKAAVRPVLFDGATGQRFDLVIWPIPDQLYTVTYTTNVYPGKLVATTAPYPIGGNFMSELVLAGALAVAEERSNDEKGIHGAEFDRQLAAAIAQDRRLRPSLRLGQHNDNDARWRRVFTGTTRYKGGT